MQTVIMILLGVDVLIVIAAFRICDKWAKQIKVDGRQLAERQVSKRIEDTINPPMTQGQIDEFNRSGWRD